MLGALAYSQFLPGSSWLHRLDPRCKLLLLGCFTPGLFCLRQWQTQLPMALLVACLPAAVGLPRRLFSAALLGVLPLAMLSLTFQAVLGAGPKVGPFSLMGLEEGGMLALRLVQLAVLAQLLALTTSPIGMCDALEQLLRPLGRLGLPYRDLALAFTIAWRFIPVLALEGDRLLKAQLARGAAWEEGPWHRRLLTLTGLLTPLMLRCFRYAEDLAVALEARGYGQTAHPSRLHPLRWRAADTLLLLTGAALLVGLAVWERS